MHKALLHWARGQLKPSCPWSPCFPVHPLMLGQRMLESSQWEQKRWAPLTKSKWQVVQKDEVTPKGDLTFHWQLTWNETMKAVEFCAVWAQNLEGALVFSIKLAWPGLMIMTICLSWTIWAPETQVWDLRAIRVFQIPEIVRLVNKEANCPFLTENPLTDSFLWFGEVFQAPYNH